MPCIEVSDGLDDTVVKRYLIIVGPDPCLQRTIKYQLEKPSLWAEPLIIASKSAVFFKSGMRWFKVLPGTPYKPFIVIDLEPSPALRAVPHGELRSPDQS